jgi:hypothetical protein
VSKKNKKKKKEGEASADAPIDGDSTEAKPRRQASPRAKKSPAKTSVKRPSAKTGVAAPSTSSGDPTDEQIRIRAYFIAERRHRLALAGNADSDWLEAKRQLLSEIGPR